MRPGQFGKHIFQYITLIKLNPTIKNFTSKKQFDSTKHFSCRIFSCPLEGLEKFSFQKVFTLKIVHDSFYKRH